MGGETGTEYADGMVDVNLDSRGPTVPLSDDEATPKAPRLAKPKSRAVSKERTSSERTSSEGRRLVPEVVIPTRREQDDTRGSSKGRGTQPSAAKDPPSRDPDEDEPMADPTPFTGGLEALEAIFPGIQLHLPLTDGRQVEIPELTEAEKDLTVEDWIRLEIERQYDILKRDGEARIALFKQRGEETRRRIEKL